MDQNLLDEVLSLLAEPTRRGAIAVLWRGEEHCVCELMSRLDATQSRMSRHMNALKAAGLVTDRRDAQWVRYRLAADLDPFVRAILEAVLAATSRPGPRRAARSDRMHSARSHEKASM